MLHSWLEDEGLHHVLAVPRSEGLWAGSALWRVDAVQAAYGDREWHRLSAGTGSKGERGYDGYDWQYWTWPSRRMWTGGHYLLFRRLLWCLARRVRA